jgi:hypothetical protein
LFNSCLDFSELKPQEQYQKFIDVNYWF